MIHKAVQMATKSEIQKQIQNIREAILRLPNNEQKSVQLEIYSLLRELDERLLKQELALIAYLYPEISVLKISSSSYYDDEGSYDSRFDGFYISNREGEEISPDTRGYLYIFGAHYYDNTATFRHAYSFSPSWDPKTFVHPMKQLVLEYVPENQESWDKLWRLITSKEEHNRIQGQSLLSAVVDGQPILQDIFANLSIPSLEENYVQKLLHFGHDWWILLYVSSEISDAIWDGHAPDDWEYLDKEDRQKLQYPVHSLFLPIIHESLSALGRDTTQFLVEAEDILGEPLSS
jgi:hypothetical protein